MPDAEAATQLLLGLGFLASIAANIAMVVSAAKRKPSIDQTLAAEYVRTKDFQQCQERCNRDICRLEARHEAATREMFGALRTLSGEVTSRIEAMSGDLKRWQLAISQQLGNIEGRVDRLENHG